MVADAVELRVVHYKDVMSLRGPRYRLSPDLKLRTRAEGVNFINQAGIVLLFPGDGLPLPDLWSAINGAARTLPKHHHDAALGKTWDRFAPLGVLADIEPSSCPRRTHLRQIDATPPTPIPEESLERLIRHSSRGSCGCEW